MDKFLGIYDKKAGHTVLVNSSGHNVLLNEDRAEVELVQKLYLDQMNEHHTNINGDLVRVNKRLKTTLHMMPCMYDTVAEHPNLESKRVHSPKCFKCEALKEAGEDPRKIGG